LQQVFVVFIVKCFLTSKSTSENVEFGRYGRSGVGRNYKKQDRKVPLIDHPNKAVQNLVVIVYLSYMV
jgi:hypothetical protein